MFKSFSALFLMLSFISSLPVAFSGDQIFQSKNTVPTLEVPVEGEGSPVAIRLNDGKFQTRYRLQSDEAGAIKNNHLQYQILLDVTISFFQDRVRLDFEGQNGSKFDSGWASTGIGNDDPNLDFFLRRLSLTMSPTKGLDFTIGSMKPEYGAGSDNTSFNNNGYIMGYRTKVALDKGELVVTTGYVGDFKDPNVFNRMGRLDEFNFVQAIVTHSIGEIAKGSLEYTQLEGNNYLRGALKFDVAKWTKFLDSVTLEDIVNVTTSGDVLAVKLDKRFKELIAGRDLTTALTYIYKTEGGFSGMPLGDKVWDGHSIRVSLAIPKIFKFKSTQLGVFLDYVQSFTDLERFRLEGGLALKF